MWHAHLNVYLCVCVCVCGCMFVCACVCLCIYLCVACIPVNMWCMLAFVLLCLSVSACM